MRLTASDLGGEAAEIDGEWSMARYIEAVESEDPKLQNEVMDEILTYNREDLEATWAVFESRRRKTATSPSGS